MATKKVVITNRGLVVKGPPSGHLSVGVGYDLIVDVSIHLSLGSNLTPDPLLPWIYEVLYVNEFLSLSPTKVVSDSQLATDSVTLASLKGIDEIASTNDVLTLLATFARLYAEDAAADEDISLSVGKSFSDSQSSNDLILVALEKVIDEIAEAGDAVAFTFNRGAEQDGASGVDNISLTVDQAHVDISLSADVFTLTMSFNRDFTEVATSDDGLALDATKGLSETATAGSSGLLTMQDYAASDFFAENYVGIFTTFT